MPRRTKFALPASRPALAAVVPAMPAAASCHEIIQDGGCIETAVCHALSRLNPNCIQ